MQLPYRSHRLEAFVEETGLGEVCGSRLTVTAKVCVDLFFQASWPGPCILSLPAGQTAMLHYALRREAVRACSGAQFWHLPVYYKTMQAYSLLT